MAGSKGNQNSKGKKNAQKLKTPELKKMAYEQYCAHIAKGKAKKSWYFEHPDLLMTWQTMEKYIADDRFFNPIYKEIAWCKGYQHWEQVVEDSAQGLNKDANTASLQMLMRNKFGWDKENAGNKEEVSPLIEKMAKKWRGLK
jgi:hypothetical protein